jgi:glycolate oxidase iron-sulfur subunit
MRRREERPVDAVIANASGCGTQLKDYRYLLRDDTALREPAAEFSGMVRDIGEFLWGLPIPDLPGSEGRGLPVACSVPCSLRHGQRLADRYPGLLRRYGFAVKVPDDDHLCCGSAGTYNLLQPENADKLAAMKAANIAATGAVVMAGGNLGCIIQLAPRLSIPATHAVQLLDWVSGGPRPPGLDRLGT